MCLTIVLIFSQICPQSRLIRQILCSDLTRIGRGGLTKFAVLSTQVVLVFMQYWSLCRTGLYGRGNGNVMDIAIIFITSKNLFSVIILSIRSYNIVRPKNGDVMDITSFMQSLTILSSSCDLLNILRLHKMAENGQRRPRNTKGRHRTVKNDSTVLKLYYYYIPHK